MRQGALQTYQQVTALNLSVNFEQGGAVCLADSTVGMQGAVGIGNETNAGATTVLRSRCSRIQRCTMFECRPCARATPPTLAPGWAQRSNTSALNCLLYSRRRERS